MFEPGAEVCARGDDKGEAFLEIDSKSSETFPPQIRPTKSAPQSDKIRFNKNWIRPSLLQTRVPASAGHAKGTQEGQVRSRVPSDPERGSDDSTAIHSPATIAPLSPGNPRKEDGGRLEHSGRSSEIRT